MQPPKVLEIAETKLFVIDLFRRLLGREPAPMELRRWIAIASDKVNARAMFCAFVESDLYRAHAGTPSYFPPGHFHSPSVDPVKAEPAWRRNRASEVGDLHGIKIDIARMTLFWDGYASYMRETPFTEARQSANRFFYEGAPFPWGDAILLRAIIAAYRPARIVEIGSGFSTACILDSAEHCGLGNLALTCVEPYADRLRGLMRAGDEERITLLEQPLQDIASDIVDVLAAGDILFIDSTHVLKTGSDVHHEIFELLPRLRPGVLVHIHDCPFPFEYPEKWAIERNYSWNEVYAIRAFLMFNARFSIFFWGSLFARRFRAKVFRDCPDFLRNPGSSLWIIRNSDPNPEIYSTFSPVT